MGVVLGEGCYFRNKNFTEMLELEKSKSQKISASYLFLKNNYPKKNTFLAESAPLGPNRVKQHRR